MDFQIQLHPKRIPIFRSPALVGCVGAVLFVWFFGLLIFVIPGSVQASWDMNQRIYRVLFDRRLNRLVYFLEIGGGSAEMDVCWVHTKSSKKGTRSSHCMRVPYGNKVNVYGAKLRGFSLKDAGVRVRMRFLNAFAQKPRKTIGTKRTHIFLKCHYKVQLLQGKRLLGSFRIAPYCRGHGDIRFWGLVVPGRAQAAVIVRSPRLWRDRGSDTEIYVREQLFVINKPAKIPSSAIPGLRVGFPLRASLKSHLHAKVFWRFARWYLSYPDKDLPMSLLKQVYHHTSRRSKLRQKSLFYLTRFMSEAKKTKEAFALALNLLSYPKARRRYLRKIRTHRAFRPLQKHPQFGLFLKKKRCCFWKEIKKHPLSRPQEIKSMLIEHHFRKGRYTRITREMQGAWVFKKSVETFVLHLSRHNKRSRKVTWYRKSGQRDRVFTYDSFRLESICRYIYRHKDACFHEQRYKNGQPTRFWGPLKQGRRTGRWVFLKRNSKIDSKRSGYYTKGRRRRGLLLYTRAKCVGLPSASSLPWLKQGTLKRYMPSPRLLCQRFRGALGTRAWCYGKPSCLGLAKALRSAPCPRNAIDPKERKTRAFCFGFRVALKGVGCRILLSTKNKLAYGICLGAKRALRRACPKTTGEHQQSRLAFPFAVCRALLPFVVRQRKVAGP